MFNASLTIHLDLKCDGCIRQITPGVEGVLALLPCIHSLQLQTCMVPKKMKNQQKALKGEKRNVYRTISDSFFEFRLFLCITAEYVNKLKPEHPSSFYRQFHDRRIYYDLSFSCLIHQKCTDSISLIQSSFPFYNILD